MVRRPQRRHRREQTLPDGVAPRLSFCSWQMNLFYWGLFPDFGASLRGGGGPEGDRLKVMETPEADTHQNLQLPVNAGISNGFQVGV